MLILVLKIISGLILSYLLGAIPTAYIFGKLYKGIDIRQYGSGNVGATNTFRVLGKVPGTIVLILDIIKGIIPTALFGDVLGLKAIVYRVVFGIVAVCGHNWTIFLQGKGGKGIATSLGVLIGLTLSVAAIRPVLLLTLGGWLIVFLASGYVSLASLVAGVLLPFWMVILCQGFELVFLGILFCIFIVFRHRPNIKRLLSGTESRVPLPYLRGKKTK